MNAKVTRLVVIMCFGILTGAVAAQGLPEWFPYTFTATLSGDQMVPPTESEATGTVVAVLTGHQLVVTGSYQGVGLLGLASGAGIHRAPAGETGEMVDLAAVPGSFMNGSYLYPPDHSKDAGTLSATFTLSDVQINDLQAGLWYVQLDTPTDSARIRGQLVPAIDLSRLEVDPDALDVSVGEFPGVWIAQGDVWGFQYYPDGRWTYLDGLYEVGSTPELGRNWKLRDNILIQDNRMLGQGTCAGHHIWYLEWFEDGGLAMKGLWAPPGCGGGKFVYEQVDDPETGNTSQ